MNKKQQRKKAIRQQVMGQLNDKFATWGLPDFFSDPSGVNLTIDELIAQWEFELLTYIANHKPKKLTSSLREIKSAGSIKFSSATCDDIRAVEKRLNLDLPNSIKTFYKMTNGLRFDGGIWLAPLENFQRLSDAYPTVEKSILRDYDLEEEELPSDEEYFSYDSQSDSYPIRPEYISHCVVINQMANGKPSLSSKDNWLLLLNKAVQFDSGEYEIWQHSSWWDKRFNSFESLVRQLYNDWKSNLLYEYSPISLT